MSSSSKVIILTGASRGMGLAMAHFLLRGGHRVVVVARTAAALAALQAQYAGQVAVLAIDVQDLAAGRQAAELALTTFARIDGLVLNHGTLGVVKRVGSSTADEWRDTFDVNFFSVVGFVQAALPALRESQGNIVMVSSGAATGNYATWGAYGSSKAAMNHFAATLAVEEPTITTLAIRPGVVDTDMQLAIRNEHSSFMDDKDASKFHSLHRDGQLLRPEQPGNVMARLVIDAEAQLSGKFLSWNDKELVAYQD